MIVTYASEKLADIRPELELLLPLHYEEIARDKHIIALDPDWDSYFAMERAGIIQCVTARTLGKLIGYHVSAIQPNLHYKQSLTARTDLYFILKEYRVGRVGIELFKEVEREWRYRGVQKAFTATKLAQDKGRIFLHLGWTEIERVFAKVLK